ncbi:pilus assembly protein TadG-related protein [Streptomyces sp. NBC_00306]|uniref:pilus assembly protein TadG-related protein n=1 Tax=Streptomyces sp. NBC_00306 TaxID=2975708 RepID=UPI002E27BE41|nr:pilus assembly protein TadG-related protein [Streptomyces sp. NBC_00306]
MNHSSFDGPVRYRRWSARDRGGISVFAAIVTVPLLVLGGLLVVDGTGKLRAAERADNVAMEAARAGAQAIDPQQAIPGNKVTVDPLSAASAVRAYLARAGVSGSVRVSDGGTRLQVDVQDSYDTTFLTLVGVSTLPVTGHGQAAVLVGITTPEEGP